MPNEQSNGSDSNADGSSNQQVTPEVITKLESQISQLNQGIASERTARKEAESKFDQVSKDFNEFKGKIEFDSEEEKIELSKEDTKKLEAWARQKGFVTAEEQQAERQRLQTASLATVQSEAVTEFLSVYPELNDDGKWPAVQAAFNEFKTPMTKAATLKILNKIAQDMGVKGTHSKSSDTDDLARAKARMINNGRLSLGGGQQASGSDGAQTVEDLQRKYPNLSRDQIESRLSEIGTLYDSKKKNGNKK